MSYHKLYGFAFEVQDMFGEGHVLTAGQAAALNSLRGERISHLARSRMTASKGDTIVEGDENHAILLAVLAEHGPTYDFTLSEGGATVRRSPVETEALALARQKVKAKAAAANLRVGKRATAEAPEETGPGVYPYSKYVEKVAEVAQMDVIVAEAKKIVAQREKSKTKTDEFDLGLDVAA